MRLLLDENMPHQLRHNFPGHEVVTVQYLGWSSLRNGELLKQLLAEGFDVLLTFDKGLQYQQNFQKYPIPVFVLRAARNTYPRLAPLIPQVTALLDAGQLLPGPVIIC